MSGAAMAADLPVTKGPAPAPAPVASTDGFDFTFGGKLMSDYISQGSTQSDHKPSATVYGELRYNIGGTQLYAGVQPWTVKLITGTPAEVDLYGGVRQTLGDFSVDVGGIYYEYPGNKRQYTQVGGNYVINAPNPDLTTATSAKNPSYGEIYIKPSYNFNSTFTLGGSVFATNNWGNVGANNVGLTLSPKINLPANFSVSADLGRYLVGRSSTKYGNFKFHDYTAWDAGVSYVYKAATLDLRYYGSDLNKSRCFDNFGDPAGSLPGTPGTLRSNWCDTRVVATLSVDFTYKGLVAH
ncbi:MAG: hypothetical protein KGQ46_03690 [Hyphomicrobiales bacterium]|nr:hypothetical protein [Hyphomicrobiales bacterium]MDE2115199.1 hypothetical protein [Hyphomicrobiales bacterium]